MTAGKHVSKASLRRGNDLKRAQMSGALMRSDCLCARVAHYIPSCRTGASLPGMG